MRCTKVLLSIQDNFCAISKRQACLIDCSVKSALMSAFIMRILISIVPIVSTGTLIIFLQNLSMIDAKHAVASHSGAQ